jgi:uncharacterized repeat protein (TIGR01451 family)
MAAATPVRDTTPPAVPSGIQLTASDKQVYAQGETVTYTIVVTNLGPSNASGVKVTVEGDDIIVKGMDLEEVSQTAANIEQETKIGKKDLGLLYSDVPAVAAGVFTRNWVKAAPVLVTRQRIQKGYLQAVLVNSGCANAFTGEKGIVDAQEMTNLAAEGLGINAVEVLVASTGVIGVPLPMKIIKENIEKIDRISKECNGLGNQWDDDPAKRLKMWAGRQGLVPSLSKIRRGAKLIPFVEDFGVPMSKIPETIRELQKISEKHQFPIPVFGHIGDGTSMRY